ncbi:2,4-dihydroxyhept-2-ene-1,7-dioic acid aldolase [Fimbriiglobus ruber]|uniref:2,4-dihydroxyhept-2-ene-1,7-dioic acid aldolase n=2 Tax=Fimbriiglobus ruber TaxID=1908690 RepID=A0A225DZC3_9BACT|nr:2,4-dihydroxyhept-2-ene-1,7-dioic acid aldolase [Fimbriiglobus ruber]
MEFATTGIGRLSAEAGAEFAVFDMEHTGWSLETIKMLIATSRSVDLVPIVRPPVTDYHHIAHAMDVGAMGLLIPLVNSEEQIRYAIECALYPPLGKRGCAFAMSHDDYKAGDQGEKTRRANENLLVVAQIETIEGLADVDAIAAVAGVDALWIGQFDLTTSLGIPGQFDHPKFTDAVKRVVDACHKHGKAATLAGLDVAELAAGPANGFRMLVYLADLWIYQQALRRCFGTIRGALGKDAAS